MPRQARRISPSGIHHVIVRGINKEDIFLEAQDYRYFLSLLRKYKIECGYKIHAYCLMINHVHLLINPAEFPIGKIMSRILVSFSMYLNSKYDRSGHLFQNRFFSEPVDGERYFFTVMRYIIRNPVKAGICLSPSDYAWSSFNAYAGYDDQLTDTELFNSRFSNSAEAVDLFCSAAEAEEPVSEYLPRVKYTDEEVRKFSEEISGCRNPGEFRDLPISKRNECIRKLREIKIPVRQIGRVTGFAKQTISRVCQQEKR